MYRVLSKSVFQIFILLALLTSLLGSAIFVTPAHAAGIIVNNNADISADDEVCTLQEAIYNANNDVQQFPSPGECDTGSGTDTITFDAGLSGQTISLSSALTITSDLTIDGSGLASQVIIDGSTSTQAFNVNSGTVTLKSLKITNGSALNGGGIFNNTGATLTISNSTLSGNNAAAGGGIYNLGLLTVTNSTFSNNSAQDGGGIYNDSNTLTMTNSTFFSNSASSGSGGGIYNFQGTLALTNNTFSGNSAVTNGGGIYNDGGTLNYANTIIANSTSGGDCAGNGGSIGTNTNNLVQDNTCSPLLHSDPLLRPLADNGGPTQTMALTLTSPAVDAGQDSICDDNPGPNNLDQRGVTRPVGAHCDIGAYEGAVDINQPTVDSFTVPASSTSFTISPITLGASDNDSVAAYLITESNTPPSASDPNWTVSAPTSYTVTGGGNYALYPWAKDAGGNVSAPYGSPASVSVCNGSLSTITVTSTADSGPGTLRQALADACAGVTINFNAALSGQTITLISDTLLILKDVTIDGSALTSKITISGNDNSRVFLVGGGVTATLNSLIITHGRFNTDGGAGLVNNGTVTITNSVFSYHTTENQYGGAILNNSTGSLTVTGSTFSNNSAFSGGAIANYNQLTVKSSAFINNGGGSTDSGGAIFTDGASGTLTQTITNSTFSGNSANVGGAIWSSRTQTITNSTFSGNTAYLNANSGGALWQDAETLNLANTIMANSSGEDCRTQSTIGIHINNLIEDGASCAPPLTADPNLDTLADNGGPTLTFALLPGSPAINAGDDTTCAAAPVSNKDQRGITRPNGDHCDIGAYEHQDTRAPNITAFSASDATTLSVSITPFTASDDGVVTGYLITESATPPAISNPNWTALAPTSYTVANAGSHPLYPWAKDDAGNVSAASTPDTVSVCLATVTVTNTNDNGPGSLRQALDDACDDTATIHFASGLAGTTINLQSPLVINNLSASLKYLTIDGSSLTSQITISGDSDNDGDGDVRMIQVDDIANNSALNITLNNLTFTKGQASGDGGAILSWAYLTITNSTFSNNSATGTGGAINSNRPLTITNSTFSGNSSTGSGNGGGAIMNNSILTVSGSTFSGNTGNATDSNGGAIYITSNNPVTITNSTFSGNSAFAGGAILNIGNLTITNSTISGNSAVATGGLDLDGGTINLANTIIANNSASYGPSNDDCTNNATLSTNTHNLIEDGSCSPALSGDPNLGSLANNGGPTQTFALLAGSKAIDAGNDTTCAASPVSNLDQRGTPRPSGGHCDIGAYEYVDTTVPSVTTFTAPALTKNLNIPITTFTASDDAVLAGYLITENNTQPSAGAAGWSASVPTAHTVTGVGLHHLYPWVKDATGHVSLAHAPADVTVDATAPTVAITRTSGSATSASVSVNFTVTFSESVSGVSASDFSLTTTGAVTGAAITTVTAVNGSGGKVYTVSVKTGSGDGTIHLNLPATATITDTAGNNVGGLPYTTGQFYTISKTLIFVSNGAQDGWVLESLSTSEQGKTLNSTATTFTLGDDATRKQYRSILSFNTSSIPDNATITGVTLKVKKSTIVGGGNPVSIFKGFMADIKNGFFGKSTALQPADFQAVGTASYGPFIVAPVSNIYSINLTGGKLNINKLTTNSGLTQIRLRFKLEDNNNTLANTLALFSGNAPAGSQPQLVITYSVP